MAEIMKTILEIVMMVIIGCAIILGVLYAMDILYIRDIIWWPGVETHQIWLGDAKLYEWHIC